MFPAVCASSAVLLLAAAFSLPGAAVAPVGPGGERPPQQPGSPPVPGRGLPPVPKPGPAPLPILPALSRYEDAAFYARDENVPHGRVEQATYKNYAGKDKRMHVYLPPGYDKNPGARYPVLYLNHGGGGDDSSWTSTDPQRGGSAQFILDNLIAAGRVKPMIVVMPDTSGIASPVPPAPATDDACSQEYLKDIIPFVESRYRAKIGRENRALAGLSMGGFVVMNTGLSHLDTFGELYVYSSGYFPDQIAAFENRFKAVFTDPKTNETLLRVPFYLAAGETDIALRNAQNTLSVLNKYGVRNFWVLSSGGHDFANCRRYLYQTAQIMFPDNAPTAGRSLSPGAQQDKENPPTMNSTNAEQEILRLSRDKWGWMSERKVDALADLFHEKAVFVHMGATMTKNQELDVIRSGEIQYKDVEIQEASVRFIGTTAIVLSTIRLVAVVGGNEVTNPFVVTEVYVQEQGAWKLGSLSFAKTLS